MLEQTVLAKFEEVAASQPKKVAIFWGGERITYGDLHARIDSCAVALQNRFNIQPRDRVGILLKNCPEFIMMLYAASKSGATVVPINTFLKAPEIQHIASDCKLKCLITSSDFDEVTGKLEGVAVVSIETVCEAGMGAATGSVQWPDVELSDLAV